MQDLEADLKRLIVEALLLEDVTVEQIDRDMPLFGEGLGLDSIDALELSMAIHRKYGVEIKADDERNQHVFGSVRSLAEFVGNHPKPEGQEI
jgi:acyl carrier protein